MKNTKTTTAKRTATKTTAKTTAAKTPALKIGNKAKMTARGTTRTVEIVATNPANKMPNKTKFSNLMMRKAPTVPGYIVKAANGRYSFARAGQLNKI